MSKFNLVRNDTQEGEDTSFVLDNKDIIVEDLEILDIDASSDDALLTRTWQSNGTNQDENNILADFLTKSWKKGLSEDEKMDEEVADELDQIMDTKNLTYILFIRY